MKTLNNKLAELNTELAELNAIITSNNAKLKKDNLKKETLEALQKSNTETVAKVKLIKNEISEVSTQLLSNKLQLIEDVQKEVSEDLNVTDDLVQYQKNTDKRKALKESNDAILLSTSEAFLKKLQNFKAIDLSIPKKQLLERVFTALKMDLESKTDGKDAIKILKTFEKYYTSNTFVSADYFTYKNLQTANKYSGIIPTKMLNSLFTDAPFKVAKALLVIVDVLAKIKKDATEAEIKELSRITKGYFTTQRTFDTSLCPFSKSSKKEEVEEMYNHILDITMKIHARSSNGVQF